MLEIHSCKDTSLYINYIAGHELPADVQVAEAFDKDEVIGFGIFEYSDDMVRIFAIDCAETALFDGIMRTILFKASMKGIDKAEFLLDNMERVYGLGVLESGEKELKSIQDIMGGCKNCKQTL